jgi:hypothetical protein
LRWLQPIAPFPGIHESAAVNGTLNGTLAKTAFSMGLHGAIRRFFSEVYLQPKLEESFRRNDQNLL